MVFVPPAELRLLFDEMQNFVPQPHVQAPSHLELQAGSLPRW